MRGQRFENRIAAIERSATTDPGLDLSLLESRVLALLRSSSSNSSSELPSLPSLNDAGSNLPVLEPSEVFSGSNMSLATARADLTPAANLVSSPVAVPEPSSLLLTVLASVGLMVVLVRRMFCRTNREFAFTILE